VASKLTFKGNKPVKRIEKSKNKQVEIIRLPPLIPTRPTNKILEKSRFFKKDYKIKKIAKPSK